MVRQAYTLLDDRGLLAVDGKDGREFLQGLISNDTDRIAPNCAIYAALLTPQGKYLHDFFVLQFAGALVLDCERERLDDLKKRLTIYKLRARVELNDLSGDFVVAYDVVDIYSVNPDLGVGSEVMSGQVMGYAGSVGSGDGWTSTHWSFGTWTPGTGKPNPEGVVEKFMVGYLCPVPYFSETERLRLFRLWDSAIYPDAGEFKGAELKERFPEVCNGPYKNY